MLNIFTDQLLQLIRLLQTLLQSHLVSFRFTNLDQEKHLEELLRFPVLDLYSFHLF